MSAPNLWRRLAAEFLGSAFLAAIVIGSGIAAQRLSPGDTGLELLENAAATAVGLFAIILMFGPVSGAHFNPVVSFADATLGGISWRDAAAYLPAQVAGCITGAVAANLMFGPDGGVDLGQAAGDRAARPVGGDRHRRAAAGDLRPRADRAVGHRPGGGRRLHRRRVLVHRPPPASRTRRSRSAGCSPTRSPGSRRRRSRCSSPRRSAAASPGVLIIRFLYPALTPAQAAQIVVPHETDKRPRPGGDQRVASDER